MVEQHDRRFAEVEHLFRAWRPRTGDRAASARFTMSSADGTPTAPSGALPHQRPAPDGSDETVAEQLSGGWAASLATRVAARDPETLRELDLPPHDRAVAAALHAIGAALPAGEQHRLRALVEAVHEREMNVINMVGYMGWEAGYGAAIEAVTGSAPRPHDGDDERAAEHPGIRE